MCHRKNSSVVILIFTRQFALNFISRSACPDSWITHIPGKRATSLYNKVRNNPMESKPVVESFFCKCYEVVNSPGCVSFIKADFHRTFGSLYICRGHVTLQFPEVQLQK